LMEPSDYREAREANIGADRMALGLSIIPDGDRGDMDVVKRMREALMQIDSLSKGKPGGTHLSIRQFVATGLNRIP
jgi:hypothetical protein